MMLRRSCHSRATGLWLALHALIAGQEWRYILGMIWLTDTSLRATSLPAAWLVATDLRPVSLPERSALRRSITAQVIKTQFGSLGEGLSLAHDTAGRPSIASMPDIGVSCATRDGLVLAALNHGAVGADIEVIEPLADIPWNVLHIEERDDLSRLTDAARAMAFYRLWTAKEAFLKATGQALLREPSGFAMRFSGDIASCADEPGLVVETRIASAGGHSCACAVARQA
jgi:4'-phosphopantetheinyl transferase